MDTFYTYDIEYEDDSVYVCIDIDTTDAYDIYVKYWSLSDYQCVPKTSFKYITNEIKINIPSDSVSMYRTGCVFDVYSLSDNYIKLSGCVLPNVYGLRYVVLKISKYTTSQWITGNETEYIRVSCTSVSNVNSSYDVLDRLTTVIPSTTPPAFSTTTNDLSTSPTNQYVPSIEFLQFISWRRVTYNAGKEVYISARALPPYPVDTITKGICSLLNAVIVEDEFIGSINFYVGTSGTLVVEFTSLFSYYVYLISGETISCEIFFNNDN